MSTKNKLEWKHVPNPLRWVTGGGHYFVDDVEYRQWEIRAARLHGTGKNKRTHEGYRLFYCGECVHEDVLVRELKRFAACSPMTAGDGPKLLSSPPPSITTNALLGDLDHRTEAPVPEITALKLEVERLSAQVAECQRTATKNYNALRQALAAIASTAAGAARALYPPDELKGADSAKQA